MLLELHKLKLESLTHMGQPCCLEGKSPPRLPLIGLLSLFILPSQRDLPRSDYWWLPTAPNFEVLGHLPGCCIWWVSNVESVLCFVLFPNPTPNHDTLPCWAMGEKEFYPLASMSFTNLISHNYRRTRKLRTQKDGALCTLGWIFLTIWKLRSSCSKKDLVQPTKTGLRLSCH